MIRTVAISSNSKTGPIAVTYRSGEHETYGTCPKSCALHPKSETGTDQLDSEYMQAVTDAVPRGGKAWTYSHFPYTALGLPAAGKTVINASCDNEAEAVAAMRAGRPAVFAAPLDTADSWPKKVDGVQFARCPADLSADFTCQRCGDGSPLCARGERNFVIVFVAHGTGKKKVGSDTGGGCYAASGPTAIQWHGTKTKGKANDAQAVRDFAKALPFGSMLRHHVAGDIGLERIQC
jgi:hypothetical protein